MKVQQPNTWDRTGSTLPQVTDQSQLLDLTGFTPFILK